MDEDSATNAEQLSQNKGRDQQENSALDKFDTESSEDGYGDDFELEEGMEQSDTSIDVAKITEAKELNSEQSEVINSSCDSKDQVENGKIPVSTEAITTPNDLQAQENVDNFISDANTSSSKPGNSIQAESTIRKKLQKNDLAQDEEEEEEEEDEEDTFNEGLLPVPRHIGKDVERKPLQEPKSVDQIRRGSVMMALPSNFGKDTPLSKVRFPCVGARVWCVTHRCALLDGTGTSRYIYNS